MSLLPPPVLNFTGRSQELTRIRQALSDFSLVAIEGPPGSGKTALALELANQLDPEQALFLRAEPGWRTDTILYALSRQWALPESLLDGTVPLDERLALLARALGRHGRTLVLDDFHQLQDGQRLLQIWRQYLRGAAVICTSRERLTSGQPDQLDMLSLRLEGLPAPEARALLQRLLSQHSLQEWEDRIERLLHLSGGYPLLIKMLVGLIREGRLDPELSQTPGQWLADLSLSAQEREVLGLLALFGHPVPAGAVGSQATLDSLERRFLVERAPGQAYFSHEVFRDHFRARLEPEEAIALHRRCAAFEQEVWEASGDLQAACHALSHLAAAGGVTEAADLLEECHLRLFQGAQYHWLLEWIERLGGSARLQIVRADVLAYLGRTPESLALLESIERSGQSEERMQALNSRCHLVLEQGLLQQAEHLAQQSLALQASARGRRPGRVKALNALALALARRGHCRPARVQAGEALRQALEIQDLRGQAYAHYALALAARAQDDWPESLSAARACELACLQAGESRLGFLSRFLTGSALMALGQSPHEPFQESLRLQEDYPDPLSRSMAFLGQALLTGELAPLARALQDAEQHGGRVFLAQALLLQAVLAERSGQAELAILASERGLRLAGEAGALPIQADLALRRELWREQPRAAELEAWRLKASQHELKGVELRARLALAACQGRELGEVDFSASREDMALVRFLQGQGPPPEHWPRLTGRVLEGGGKPLRLVTEKGQQRVERVSLQPSDFDLWLDLVERRVFARGREVSLLRRKAQTSVLRSLMLSYPTPRSPRELYLEVWGGSYQGEESDAAVRKAVSHLRDLFEPERSQPRVIGLAESGYGQRGGYVLGPGVRFCLVEPFQPSFTPPG